MTVYDNTNNPPNLLRIPDNSSITLQKVYMREFCERTLPEVELVRLDREETVVDELYLEATARRFMSPLKVRANIEHRPSKKSLTRFGLEQERAVLFHVPTLYLGDIDYLMAEPNDTWIIGDLIKWGMDYYEVKDQIKNNEAYWGQTNVPLYITLACDYYRHGT